MRTLTIPRFVDDPPPFLIFSAEQSVPFMVAMVLGVMIHQLGLMCLAGFALSYIYARFMHSKPDGYLFHMLYWYGIYPTKGRLFLNPFVRIFIG